MRVSSLSLQQQRLTMHWAALARERPAGQGSDPSLCLACMRHLEHRVQVWGLRLLILKRIQRRATERVTDLGHRKYEYRPRGLGCASLKGWSTGVT